MKTESPTHNLRSGAWVPREAKDTGSQLPPDRCRHWRASKKLDVLGPDDQRLLPEGRRQFLAKLRPPRGVKLFDHHLNDQDVVMVLGCSRLPASFGRRAGVGGHPAKTLGELAGQRLHTETRGIAGRHCRPRAGEVGRDACVTLSRPHPLFHLEYYGTSARGGG